jgi:signal peptidase I
MEKPVSVTTRRRGSANFAENVKTIVYALLIAAFIRSFLFQPFNIPSGSVLPSLLIGDYIFVAKYPYGFSKFSFPFAINLFSGRIFDHHPKRGDVVVFKLPRDTGIDYIKRVIGLPGDRIQMRDSRLYINGKIVARDKIDDFVEREADGNVHRYPQYIETLPNGVRYHTLDVTEHSFGDNTPVFLVPPHHYFMMGDNRDNSQDSRFENAVGYVPEENLVGRAELVFFSTNGSAHFWEFWKWPAALRWQRAFHLIS